MLNNVVKKFPSTLGAVLVALVVGFVIWLLPWLGSPLAKIITPILVAVGAIFGYWHDLRFMAIDRAMGKKIDEKLDSLNKKHIGN